METASPADVPRSVFRVAEALVALFFSAVTLTAAQPSHSLTQYAHTAWGRQDGRSPAGAIYAVTQRLDGSLWVGTEFGLFRFDGVTFAPWKPPAGTKPLGQTVTALAPATDGGLWIGTRKGVSYWKNEQLTNYPTNGMGVSSVVVDRAGATWVGTAGFNSGAICRVQAVRLACFDSADGYDGRGVLTLFLDKAGYLWVGSAGGLYRWNSSRFRQYGSDRGIEAIAQDKSSGELVVSSPRGLLKLPQQRLTEYSTGKPIGDTGTTVLLSDRDGGLWIGTIGRGLLHYYRGRLDNFMRSDGLSGDTVLGLFEDREGNIWAATDRGLDSFRDLPVTTLSRREGLSTDTVVSVSPSRRGGVWLGTREGLNRVWDGGIDTDPAGRPFGNAHSVFEDRSGTLWVDSPRGLIFGLPDNVQILRDARGRPTGYIAGAAEGSNGEVWFSDLNHGLIRVEGRRVKKVIPWSQFDNRLGSALDVDPVSGGLLIGFAQGGVADFDGDRPIRWYTDRDGLGSGAVTDLHFDADGVAWIATENGLSRLRNGRIATLGLSNGLACVQIHSMVEDDDRSLWADTACGLIRITRQDLAAWSADPTIRIKPTSFGIRDGMHLRAQKSGYFRGAAKSTDGRLWFPDVDGVLVVDPRHLPHNPLPPPVEIDSVRADQAAYTIHPGLKLPHISRQLQIEYTAFSFVDPDAVRFKYQLQGYDRGWIDAGARRQALYPNLSPGQYRFRAIAANNDGVWNNVGASLEFSVAPMYYETLWFRLLCVTVVFGAIWMLYSLRVKQLEAKLNLRFEERMRERTRIGRDLHDTLLQSISGFALRLDALSKAVTTPESARDHLRELRQQAEIWLREARESVWDLRADASHEDDLVTAIQRTGTEFAGRKGIAFEVRTSGCPRAVEVPTRGNLLGIVQEALRNAAAHSYARKIDVHLSYLAKDQLRIEIRDDGRGFDFDVAARKPGHWGLATMRERAQEIGAEFQIETSPGNGVRIEIRSPVAPLPHALVND